MSQDNARQAGLLPCPFCGSNNTEIANTHTPKFWVECNDCEAEARGAYFEGPPAESHFHYDPLPNSDFDGDYEQLPENYKAAFRSAVGARNKRAAQSADAKRFGIEIGEHSNLNCPWANALQIIEDEPAQQSATPADAASEADKRGDRG